MLTFRVESGGDGDENEENEGSEKFVGFKTFGLHPTVLNGLRRMGFKIPTNALLLTIHVGLIWTPPEPKSGDGWSAQCIFFDINSREGTYYRS